MKQTCDAFLDLVPFVQFKACARYFSLFLKDKCISSLFRTKFRKNNLLIRKNNCMCNRDNARDVAACPDE